MPKAYSRAYRAPASVAAEYDRWTTDGLLEFYWGEHIHHGYYPRGRVEGDFKQQKVEMIDRLLDWAGVRESRRVLDVGCGIGGSSRHIARRFPNAEVTGVTLSPRQVARGEELTAEQGLSARVEALCADALALPFARDTFDLVWACESAEHMPDKDAFLAQMTRVVAPGGVVALATWCHRPTPPALSAGEVRRLKRICNEWALPTFVDIGHYAAAGTRLGLEHLGIDDWSRQAAPTWEHQIRVALVTLPWLLQRPWPLLVRSLRDARAVAEMILGFRTGLVRYGLFRAQKPRSARQVHVE